MTKLNIHLVRHGQTFFNIYNKLQGWNNSSLTMKSKGDANVARGKLQNIHFDSAFCSDLSRTIETAQVILNLNNTSSITRPVTAPYPREEFCGSYKGANISLAWYNAGAPYGFKSFREIITAYSISQAKDWLKNADPFHDAEDNEEYWQRINRGIKLIQNTDLPDNANALWVNHGNTVLSLVERSGYGEYDVIERPANESLTHTTSTDNDMEIVKYNK